MMHAILHFLRNPRRLACLVSILAAGPMPPLATAGTMPGLTQDTDVRSDGFLVASSASGLLPGGSGSPALDRSSVFVFQLPNLGAVADPFEVADFRFHLSLVESGPPNLDLYGIPRRSSAVVLASDYYGETPVADPTQAVRLQTGILTASSPAGLKSTGISGRAALRDFLNAQYAGGAGAGQHVFLRFSTSSPPGGVKRYTLTSANGGVASPVDTRPRIVYNEPVALLPRPFIWVRDAEKPQILAKIAGNAWATSLRNSLQSRMNSALSSHQANRDAYLRELPVDWNLSPAVYRTTRTHTESQVRGPSESKFNAALDCAVLYWLTGDTRYARLAGDILHNTVRTLIRAPASTSVGNGGWIFDTDFLKEARVTGTQLPMVYDFLYSYLNSNQVYDVQTGGMADFAFDDAQAVFRKLYQLCRDHGQTGSNWSALMATCMLNNLLAIDDDAERAANLEIYITTGGPRQTSLANDYEKFAQSGDIWPESLQYAGAVGNIRTTHMVLIERYDPTRNLFAAYPNFPLSLPRISFLVNPNNQLVRFGDGQRSGGTPPYERYEMVYQHALARGRSDLRSFFGPLIKAGVDSGQYNRASLPSYTSLGQHDELLKLLWSAPAITEPASPPVLPRTDRLPFAGITLQRNPSPSGVNHGLMGFIGGAGHVHSHASGMGMELYGLGHVLGAKGGRDDYGSTIHERYYRLFAANNTVIVNGASRGEGGWAGLAINTVQNVAMEPAASAQAVSPDHSFSVSSFADDKGAHAKATQQRTLALVRTSPTSGFYVDVFRSKSTVTNRSATTLQGSVTNQYHDYIYRNVGNLNPEVLLGGSPATFVSQPSRFQNDIGDSYQQPGWRHFTQTVVTHPHQHPMRARFVAAIGGQDRCMTMHMPAVATRETARVESPAITDAPSPYTTAKAPTLVIRQFGDAWDRPFAAVYEPHFGVGGGTVRNVTHLEKNGVVVGLKIEGRVAGQDTVHYILAHPADGQTYEDPSIGLSFTGRFGIVADRGNGSLSLYLGRGSSLSYRSHSLATQNGGNSQAEARFAPGAAPEVGANTAVTVREPPPPSISFIDDVYITPTTSPASLPFTVSDLLVPVSEIVITARSSDPALFPAGSLVVSGSGGERSLTLSPAPGLTGAATITLLADNGNTVGTRTFRITVASGTFLTEVLPGLAADAGITDAPAIENASSATGMLGTGGNDPWVDRCAVFVFQLPDFGPVGQPFLNASFSFHYLSKTGTPGSNDLYGIAARAAATVLTSDYYGKTTAPDPKPGTIRLQADILDGGTPFGVISTSDSGNAALADYLNAAYASGAGAGKHVFLRLNSVIPKTSVKRANITFAEGGAVGPPDTRPRIRFTALLPDPKPVLSTPADVQAAVGEAIAPVAVTVGDEVIPAAGLVLAATSSNQALLPDARILVSGSGAQRVLTLDPVPDRLGKATITLTVDNGTATASSRFELAITGDARQQWRFHHFGTTADSGPAAMSANPDGDGFDNETEYRFGTDPSAPDLDALLKLSPFGEEPSIEFTALKAEGPGYEGMVRVYTVQTCEDLVDWQPMPGADDIIGFNQSVLIELPGSNGTRFYRLKIVLIP
jgi:hypothetical protein